jgi:hypothetical protein
LESADGWFMEKNDLGIQKGISSYEPDSGSAIEADGQSYAIGDQPGQLIYKDVFAGQTHGYRRLENRCNCVKCQQAIWQRGILNLTPCPSCNHLHYRNDSCKCGRKR